MKTLLANRYAPLTYSVGFLEAPFDELAQVAVDWQKSLFANVDITAMDAPLAEALPTLEPLIIPPRKILLVATQSDWVAYFDNGIHGPDPAPFIGHMARRYGCRGAVATCIPRPGAEAKTDAAGAFDAVGFDLYAAEDREWLNVERTISVVNDYGKWEFKASGSIQPFERPEQYKAKGIKDRFTPDMLEDYCASLGIRVFDAAFYGPTGLLLDIRDPLPPEFVPISLAEARKRLGLAGN